MADDQIQEENQAAPAQDSAAQAAPVFRGSRTFLFRQYAAANGLLSRTQRQRTQTAPSEQES